jgi:hypothetical protein
MRSPFGGDIMPRSTASKDYIALWHNGALFHAASRYPRKPKASKVDRLASILRNGLLAPASGRKHSVCSDLNLVVTGMSARYDSFVFLHRYGPQSGIYTFMEPERFMVFVDPAFPVLTAESMGTNWIILCQDEVYVRDHVPVAKLISVVIHPEDADSVMAACSDDLRRLGIPLYDCDGEVVCEPQQQASARSSY